MIKLKFVRTYFDSQKEKKVIFSGSFHFLFNYSEMNSLDSDVELFQK